MCVILDTNRFSTALKNPTDPQYLPLLNWILGGQGLLIFGGTKYDEEIDNVAVARTFFAQRLRAGQAFRVPKAEVDAEEAAVRLLPHESDDEHIVALARLSGARTVCTEDSDLMSDFKDPSLVSKPRGRVYRSKSHLDLLQHDRCCRRPTRKRQNARRRRGGET
jgi:hypothetical protein